MENQHLQIKYANQIKKQNHSDVHVQKIYFKLIQHMEKVFTLQILQELASKIKSIVY